MKEHIVLRNNSAFCTSVGFWKGLRRSEPRGDSGGSGWRKEAVKNVEKCVTKVMFFSQVSIDLAAAQCSWSAECCVRAINFQRNSFWRRWLADSVLTLSRSSL